MSFWKIKFSALIYSFFIECKEDTSFYAAKFLHLAGRRL